MVGQQLSSSLILTALSESLHANSPNVWRKISIKQVQGEGLKNWVA